MEAQCHHMRTPLSSNDTHMSWLLLTGILAAVTLGFYKFSITAPTLPHGLAMGSAALLSLIITLGSLSMAVLQALA